MRQNWASVMTIQLPLDARSEEGPQEKCCKSLHESILPNFMGLSIEQLNVNDNTRALSTQQLHPPTILWSLHTMNLLSKAFHKAVALTSVLDISITNHQMAGAPPTRGQLRLQGHTQVPVQDSHSDCHQPTLDPLLADECQANIFRLAMC